MDQRKIYLWDEMDVAVAEESRDCRCHQALVSEAPAELPRLERPEMQEQERHG